MRPVHRKPVFSRLNLRSDVENTIFHKDLPDSAVPVQLRQSYIKSSKKCVEDRIILFFPKPVIEFQLSDEDGVLLQSLLYSHEIPPVKKCKSEKMVQCISEIGLVWLIVYLISDFVKMDWCIPVTETTDLNERVE